MLLLILTSLLMLTGVNSYSDHEMEDLPMDEVHYYHETVNADDHQCGNVAGVRSDTTKCASSTHLWWWVPFTDFTKVQKLEFHITVIPNSYAKVTYFAAAGFSGGYSGFQQNRDQKVTIFSIWNGEDLPNDIAYLIEKGPDTLIDDFGGEGTGQRSNIIYDWKVDVPIEFIITFRPIEAPSHWSIRCDVKTENKTMYMATFGRRSYSLGHNFYSFIEDYSRPTGSEGYRYRRSAKFSDVYVIVDGKRHDIETSEFSRNSGGVEAAGAYLCMSGAVDKKFFLATGGYTDNDEQITIPTTKYYCEDNNCIAHINETFSYKAAKKFCTSLGGTLPVVKNEAKQKLLLSAATKFATCMSKKYVWIGLNDEKEEGKPVWEDGTSLSEGDYDKRHPSDTGHYYDDCYLLGVYPGDTWYDSWSDTRCYKIDYCTLCDVDNSRSRNEDLLLVHGEDDDPILNNFMYYHQTLEIMQNRGDPAKPAATTALSYSIPITDKSSVKYVDFHVTVRPVMYYESTYFAVAFNGGTFGIQQRKTDKVAIALIKNGVNGKATVVDKGDGATVTEQEKGLSVTIPMQWKVDTNIELFVLMEIIDETSTGKIRLDLQMENEAVYLGTFERPGQVIDGNFHNFIEDFNRADGATGWTRRRSAKYGDIYAHVDDTLIPVNKAKFTRVSTGLDAASYKYCTSGITDGFFVHGTGGKTDLWARYHI